MCRSGNAAPQRRKYFARAVLNRDARIPAAKMTPRFFFRRTQALWTALVFCSMAACSYIKDDRPHGFFDNATRGGATNAGAQREAAAPPESALDAQLSGLRQQIDARRSYLEGLRFFAGEKEQQLAAVLASDRSAGPSVQEFDLRTSINAKLGEIDRAAVSWQETIDAHKAVLQKAGDDSHVKDLQTEINHFSEARAELLRQRARLAGITDKLKK